MTVRHGDVTARLAGALTTDVVDDVSLTAERITEIVSQAVGVDTATDAHATERRRLDDDHFVVTATAWTERLQLTVLASLVYHIPTYIKQCATLHHALRGCHRTP